MDWLWEQERLLEDMRGLIATGSGPHDILALLDEDAWTLHDAARALQALFGHDQATAMHIIAAHPAYAAVALRISALHAQLREATNDTERVLILLQASERRSDHGRRGASEETIDAFGTRLNIVVPDELRAWLRIANGSLAGYGGFFGIRPERPIRDIEEESRRLPEQFARTWLPIAGDGCGSLYILALHDVTSCGPAVIFLDWEHSQGELFNVASYAVASGIWPFLRLQLMSDLDLLDWHWPFDKERTLQEDPALAQVTSARLPWDT